MGQQDLLSRGQSALQVGDLAAAESAFRAHLKANPNSAEAMSNVAAVLARKEQYGEAVALYQRALKANPKLTQVRFNLGIALMRSGSLAPAAQEFQKFLLAYPEELRARQLLGICLVELGDFSKGIVQLEKVLEAQPNEPSVLFTLAYAHARGGDDRRGAALLARVDSQPGEAAFLRGLIHYRTGQYEEARAEFEETLRHRPEFAPALSAIGRLYLLDRKDAEAVSYLERALNQTPQDAESTYQLGVLLDRNGEPARGEKLLLRAIELRPGYGDPHYQLARIFLREKRLPDALRHADAAARLLPEHESVRFLRARIYMALGQNEKAQTEFAEVRRLKTEAAQRDRKRFEREIPLEQ
jgi:tetratricopeptide (TPR) repeat protein